MTVARIYSKLDTLESRRQNLRKRMFRNIISAGPDVHPELMADIKSNPRQTRAGSQGEPVSIMAVTSVYSNSFLPRTIRETHGGRMGDV